uniref:hypothetical protein n=1 Tax=Hylemonella sp. TaxID=2066020 RepID=UPI0035B4B072
MESQIEQEDEGGAFESYFRDPSQATESPLAWAIGQRLDLLDAMRGLFSGPRPVVQLRIWCFMELASVPQGRIARDDLNRLFYALQPQALDNVLKRLRDTGLVIWDQTSQDYSLSGLAQQIHGLLVPFTKAASDDDELASLLAQVAGAHALGLTDASHLKHLHAQLSRLHDEFADAIASGSEARLREAQPRFERALTLVERAGEALTALIRSESEDPRLEREARALGHAQATLLSMASQFTRAMQQADRQRVTLGSTGVTSSDVRQWLRDHAALHDLLGDALSLGVQPIFVSQHDLIDVAEGEFERDRPDPARSTGLPPPAQAGAGEMQVLRMPQELEDLINKLTGWRDTTTTQTADPKPIQEAVLGGRFAQAAYRMQLLPLLGDAQAKTLKGQTGELARSGWRPVLETTITETNDQHVAAMSQGRLEANQEDSDEHTG